jgi:hypothetical protein
MKKKRRRIGLTIGMWFGFKKKEEDEIHIHHMK